MRTLPLFLLALVAMAFSLTAAAQTDKMYKHNGETAKVKIIKVGEYSISYTYEGETAQQVISKYAVSKIEYASGRTEDISEKIIIGGKDDWAKVVFLEDKGCLVGLKKVGEFNAWSYGWTTGNSDKRTTMKIKKAAALKGGEFIFVATEKTNQASGEAMMRADVYAY